MNTPPLDSHISHMRPHTPPKSKEITLSEQDAEFALRYSYYHLARKSGKELSRRKRPSLRGRGREGMEEVVMCLPCITYYSESFRSLQLTRARWALRTSNNPISKLYSTCTPLIAFS